MDATTKHNSLATMPFQKTKVDNMRTVLRLPDGKRIIIHSWDGSFRVWDLETDTQDGEEWEDKDQGVRNITLSPDGKKIASGSRDGTVKLWNIDTGKVIKTLTGYTKEVCSVNWSPDGGRVVSGSDDGTFRVWDVQSGKTILGPINVGDDYNVLAVKAVCYSPDAKMIATGARWNGGPDVKIIATAGLKIWDANSGELFKTFKGRFWCLAWTLDGKTLIAGRLKIDTATWTVLTLCKNYANAISLSPNNRILATTSFFGKTAQLWNLETNKPIGTPLHHQGNVTSATFSADGKFLVTDCLNDREIYTWDVSSIIKKADLSSNIADVILRPAPKIKLGARIPPGFFDDALREANSHIRLSQSHAPPTSIPLQHTLKHTLSPFTSFWRRSRPHEATEPATQSRFRPFSWIRNLSGTLRRRDGSDIQLREVEAPSTAGKPRNYHATGKQAATSSRPPKIHATQQLSTSTQNTLPLSQQPPPTRITIDPGWRARIMRWVCCMPIQNTDGQR